MFVDALYDRLPVLSDWTLLVTCMGDDGVSRAWGLPGMSAASQLLLASLRKAADAAPTSGTAAGATTGVGATGVDGHAVGGGGAYSGGGRSVAGPRPAGAGPRGEQALHDASVVLMGSLPGLITRHMADAHTVAPLVGCLRHLKLELYTLRAAEGGWKELLDLVSEQLVGRAPSQSLLLACAEALVSAARDAPGALLPAAGLVLGGISKRVVDGLQVAARAVMVSLIGHEGGRSMPCVFDIIALGLTP